MYNTASLFATAILAGQIAMGAYIPLRASAVQIAVDGDAMATTQFYYNPKSSVSSSHDSTSNSVSNDPMSSVHYFSAPQFTYETMSLAHEARDIGVNPINGLPVPSATNDDGLVPCSSLTISTSERTAMSANRSTPESPNPTAVPSAFGLQPGITLIPLTQTVVSGHTTAVPISKPRSHGSIRPKTTLITKTKVVTSFDYAWTHSSSATPEPHTTTKKITRTVAITFSSIPPSSLVEILTMPGTPSKSSVQATFSGTSKAFEYARSSDTEIASASATTKPKSHCAYPYPDCP